MGVSRATIFRRVESTAHTEHEDTIMIRMGSAARRRLGYGAIARPFALLLAAALAGAACTSGGSTGPSDDDTTGTYELLTVEEVPVPVRVWQGPLGYQGYLIADVNGGSLELTDDGEFTIRLDVWYNWDGEVETDVRVLRGFYEIDGPEIIFTFPNNGDVWGLYEDGVVEITLNGAGIGVFHTYAFGR